MIQTKHSMTKYFSMAVVIFFTLTGCGNNPVEGITKPEISLMDAAMKGKVEMIRQHITAGTKLDEQDPHSGSTALIAAATFGQTEAALTLIENGADLEVQNNEGSTALITAAFFCRTEIVKALLEKGAERGVKNNTGATALDSVTVPFNEIKPVYDLLQGILGPAGLKLDYQRIQATRPKIAELLQDKK
jgi:hypothetical protein